MKIVHVPAPKYKIGRHIYNEYEIRTIMNLIKSGQIDHTKIKLNDFNPHHSINNKYVVFDRNGMPNRNIFGFDLADSIALKTYSA